MFALAVLDSLERTALVLGKYRCVGVFQFVCTALQAAPQAVLVVQVALPEAMEALLVEALRVVEAPQAVAPLVEILLLLAT